MTDLKRTVAVAGPILLSLALAGPARAQMFGQNNGASGGGAPENIAGFTVAGKGAVAARPNRLEIDLEVSAASELSADAIVKYRDAKKRLQDAFAALKMKDVAVEERSLLVDQKSAAFNPYMMDSAPARKGKIEVQLTRKLVVTCGNIRAMDEEALLQLVAKLLDVAQDAGGKLAGGNQNNFYYYYYGGMPPTSGLVRFILDDFEELKDKAYQGAVDDARKRAGRLARLGGVELGAVAGVREVAVPGDKASSEEELTRPRIESSKFQEIPVRVELLVRFDAVGPKGRTKEGGQ